MWAEDALEEVPSPEKKPKDRVNNEAEAEVESEATADDEDALEETDVPEEKPMELLLASSQLSEVQRLDQQSDRGWQQELMDVPTGWLWDQDIFGQGQFLKILICDLMAAMSEKLCLQWNDFKANVNSAFRRLRDDKELTDVTLACEDGQQVEAHKVILAASSPFFEKILQRNKHPHPLIYLRGFQSQDLLAILDFLYFGEANVYQENLDSFLAIAKELKLKELSGQSIYQWFGIKTRKVCETKTN